MTEQDNTATPDTLPTIAEIIWRLSIIKPKAAEVDYEFAKHQLEQLMARERKQFE